METSKAANRPKRASGDGGLGAETFNIIGNARDSIRRLKSHYGLQEETPHPSTGHNIINVGPIGENLLWLEHAR